MKIIELKLHLNLIFNINIKNTKLNKIMISKKITDKKLHQYPIFKIYKINKILIYMKMTNRKLHQYLIFKIKI